MKAEENVAVVIVNYYCEELICRCLDSLKANVKCAWTPIVIDNSDSPSTDQIRKQHPDAVIINSGRNRGFAGGCNLGIDYALTHKYRYILLLNPDTRAEMDFLSVMLDVFLKHPEYGMLGPKIFFDDHSRKVWNCGGELNWWLGGQRRLLPDPPAAVTVQPATYLSGCAMLLRPEAVRQAGMMDDRYFLYFEDVDYVQAMILAGWRVGYVHAARLYHRVSATTKIHSPEYVYYFSRNRIWFMRKWAKIQHLVFFTLFNTLVKLPASWLVFAVIKGRGELARAFWRGWRDGFRGS